MNIKYYIVLLVGLFTLWNQETLTTLTIGMNQNVSPDDLVTTQPNRSTMVISVREDKLPFTKSLPIKTMPQESIKIVKIVGTKWWNKSTVDLIVQIENGPSLKLENIDLSTDPQVVRAQAENQVNNFAKYMPREQKAALQKSSKANLMKQSIPYLVLIFETFKNKRRDKNDIR